MSDQMNDSRIKKEHSDFAGLIGHRQLIHDLRNALSPILMQAQLLSQYAETPGTEADAIKKSADALEKNVKAMVTLLNDK